MRSAAVVIAIGTLAALPGCGGSSTSASGARSPAPRSAGASASGASPASGPSGAYGASPATGPSGPSGARRAGPTVEPGVDPAAVAVIRAWSTALSRGDLAAAGRYFALPSVISFGPGSSGGTPVLRLTTRSQAERTGLALPCGASLVSARRQGPYVDALFLLTERTGPGAGCGAGTGGTARTDFLIRAGRIIRWLRAPDEAGDGPAAGAAPAGPPPAGATPAPSAPAAPGVAI